MMKWLILAFFSATLVADIYLWRSVVRRHFGRRFSRAAFLVLSVASAVAALSAFFIYTFSDLGSGALVVVEMWSLWLFIVISLPKLLFVVGMALDGLVRLVSRRRITAFRWSAIAVSSVCVAVLICGATVGRTKLRIEQVEICSPRIPAAFDGYRIVQISDIHVGTMCDPARRLAVMVDAINSLGADMVVNTGDLVNIDNKELTPEVMAVLSEIATPDGVWSVWGNHDLGFYVRDTITLPLLENHAALAAKVSEMGWRTLSDSSTEIRRGEDGIVLSGVGFPTIRMNGTNNTLGGNDLEAAFEGVGPESYNIVLSHTPELWEDILNEGQGDLTLSGHVHALQMKFRLFGREFSPARLVYDRWSGKYISQDAKNSVLYVNDGIGCVAYPMRIGARPEITVITLKRCE